MRRAISAFLAALLLLTSQAVAVRADEPDFFADVPPSQWYAAAVRKLWNVGVVKGSGGTPRFRPDDPITRAEFIKMLVLTNGLVVVGVPCTGAFSDVPCDHWASPYVELAYRLAIAEGVQRGRFDPAGLVTRQEMVTMLQRALGRALMPVPADLIAGTLGKFGDAAAVSGWARGAMALAVRDGFLQGLPGGKIEPGRRASRAEAAALLERAALPNYQRAAAITVDGHNLPYRRVLLMKVTAYAADEPGMSEWTFTGLRVRIGSIAVDPSVIPLGTLLYVDGYGYGIAADTGSAIKGNKVDVFVASAAQADVYGIQTRPVYIIESAPPAPSGGGV